MQYLDCRKCRSFRWIPGCNSGGQVIRCAHIMQPVGISCSGFWSLMGPLTPKPEAPAVKPLLVDELADVVAGMMGAMTGSFYVYRTAPLTQAVPKEILCKAEALVTRAHVLLARHKEVVDDAEA